LPICGRSGKHQGTADQKDPELAPQSLKRKVVNIDERSYLVPPTQELIGDALELRFHTRFQLNHLFAGA
jgi:hypothetical protein